MTHIAFLDPPAAPASPTPPAPPGGGGPGTPTPAGAPRRDKLLGLGVVLVLVAILAGTAVWRVGRSDASTDVASAPTTTTVPGSTSSSSVAGWPVEVQPLVAFVERTRGGTFDEPVPINYLPRDEYEAKAQGENSAQSDEERQQLEMFEGQLKALDLADSTLDLGASADTLAGSGTLAYYDPEANEINVLGTDLDVAHRVTLVHELTHAWQDQHGFLDQLDDLDDGQASTLHALAEGDAMRVEAAYVDSLSSSDKSSYESQSQKESDEADLSDVPEALVTAFSSPYALGGPYAKLLVAKGGNEQINEAMGDPPRAEADLIALQRWFQGAKPTDVDEPSVPDGAERLDGSVFGAVSWIMTLGERVDPRDALHLVDGWAGDNSVTYRQDGRICTAAAYEGTSVADTDRAAATIGAWAAAMPAAYGASVERTGDVAILRSCEPASGADTQVVGRTQTSMLYPALRTEIAYEVADAGNTLTDAVCFANAAVDQFTVEQMQSGAYNDSGTIAQVSAAARQACPGVG